MVAPVSHSECSTLYEKTVPMAREKWRERIWHEVKFIWQGPLCFLASVVAMVVLPFFLLAQYPTLTVGAVMAIASGVSASLFLVGFAASIYFIVNDGATAEYRQLYYNIYRKVFSDPDYHTFLSTTGGFDSYEQRGIYLAQQGYTGFKSSW